MGSVFEIIHRRCGSGTLAELQGRSLSGVARLAAGKFLTGLMGMTIIAFGMAGEAGLELSGVKAVTGVAPGGRRAGRHLGLVTMDPVREFLDSELVELCREADGFWHGLQRHLVAHYTKSARF